MDLAAFNSLLIRLENASQQNINEALSDVLETDSPLERTLDITCKAIRDGKHIVNDHLVTLLVRTKSTSLYKLVRDQLICNTSSVLSMYESGFEDAALEPILIRKLYEIASEDGNHLRTPIAQALGRIGTISVLPTLEALIFDLAPSVRVRDAFPDAYGMVEILEARGRSVFLKEVAYAIEQVSDREKTSDNPSASVHDWSSKNEDELNVIEAEKSLVSSQRHIDDKSPQIALFLLRLGAEKLAKNAYRRLGCERKTGKPARKMKLEDLINQVRNNGGSEVFTLLLQTLQLFGNFASHDQEDNALHLTIEMASALQMLYKEAMNIEQAAALT